MKTVIINSLILLLCFSCSSNRIRKVIEIHKISDNKTVVAKFNRNGNLKYREERGPWSSNIRIEKYKYRKGKIVYKSDIVYVRATGIDLKSKSPTKPKKVPKSKASTLGSYSKYKYNDGLKTEYNYTLGHQLLKTREFERIGNVEIIKTKRENRSISNSIDTIYYYDNDLPQKIVSCRYYSHPEKWDHRQLGKVLTKTYQYSNNYYIEVTDYENEVLGTDRIDKTEKHFYTKLDKIANKGGVTFYFKDSTQYEYVFKYY